MVEYADKREEELFRDESAVFTMTDWEKNINFAILHYVHNDAVNESSRIEEQYMLIDLKSGKDITKEIEKYSGIYLNNFTIYKNKSGKVYLDNFGKFKIELK
jgi:predicted Zn-dependent protease with MMP-like domain